MKRRLFPVTRRRAEDRELEEAQRRAARSRVRASRDLKAAKDRLADSRAVAADLARHNQANRYDDWLERQFLGGRS